MADSPAPIRSPGEFIREQLDRRDWTQADLARILDRPLPTINRIIKGTHGVMPEMAIALAAALGGTPEEWLARESAYRLSLATTTGNDIARRVRLYELAPIKDMEKRGWISTPKNDDDLEESLKRFFGLESLDDEPPLFVAVRKTDADRNLSDAQRAWCFRAIHLAKTVMAARFDEARLDECARQLRSLIGFPQEARKVPRVLADFGIRFVIVEPLPGSKMDGAAFWLDDQSPVIAVSVRYDRIDAFWFTLWHEFIHIKYRDGVSIDIDLTGEPSIAKSDIERRADNEASAMLIPPTVIDSFIQRVAPRFSKDRINQFANKIKVHPGIIVGQLQHRGQIGYQANREMLVKVRDIVAESAMTDGWGRNILLET